MQQSEQALAFYAKAAELSRIPSCKVNSYFRSGWIAMHERKHENAADFFRKAIDCGDLLFVQDDAYRHATYWYAVCLEAEGLYLDALVWYRRAQSLSPLLEPESRYRQILWLVRIGLYDEALNVCRTFDAPPPEEFDRSRYEELRSHARHERNMLAACVNSEPAALDAGRERQGDAYAIR
jgi:tetratricopeptide (TPR) repeat protein